jgi:hypothetical protein
MNTAKITRSVKDKIENIIKKNSRSKQDLATAYVYVAKEYYNVDLRIEDGNRVCFDTKSKLYTAIDLILADGGNTHIEVNVTCNPNVAVDFVKNWFYLRQKTKCINELSENEKSAGYSIFRNIEMILTDIKNVSWSNLK